MAQAHIVTGRMGEPHITAHDDRVRNAEEFGKDKFVFNIGKRLWATKVSNTAVSIADGMCMSYGTQMGIEPLSTQTLTIDPGVSGYKRCDLIVMQYTKDTVQDVESAELVVLKGTPVVSNPTPREDLVVDGDITNGATEDMVKLWEVYLDGTAITDLVPVYKLRSGLTPTDPTVDPEGTAGEPDPESVNVINEAVIDKLWGSSIADGDAGRY